MPLAFIAIVALSSCGGGGGSGSLGPSFAPSSSEVMFGALPEGAGTTPPTFTEGSPQDDTGANTAHENDVTGEGATAGNLGNAGSTNTNNTFSSFSATTYSDGKNFTPYVFAQDEPAFDTQQVNDYDAAENSYIIQEYAPGATVISYSFDGTDDSLYSAYTQAVVDGVQVFNNSWAQVVTISGTYNGNSFSTTDVPLLEPLFNYHYGSNLPTRFSRIATIVRGIDDMVFVWAAGDHGWRSGGVSSAIRLSAATPITVSQNDFISDFILSVEDEQSGNTSLIAFSELEVDPDDAGGYALAPLYEPSLLGRWANVVALDDANVIADFSNGCGEVAKYWCISAPGAQIEVDSSGVTTTLSNNTGVAASYLSGALALLKSRVPHAPMNAVLALLFTTAIDLGESGVDDVYGHGLVNISELIVTTGSVSLPSLPSLVYSAATSTIHFTAIAIITSTVMDDVTNSVTSSLTSTITTTVISFISTISTYSSLIVTFSVDIATYTVGNATYTATLSVPDAESTINYNTTEFQRNYGLAQIGAQHAYQRGYLGQGATVGVVDTGVRTTHLDLMPNLVPGRRADSFGNLYSAINDANGHGTFVAGVIGAAMDDSRVHGVAPLASIMPLQMGNVNYGNLSGDPIALFTYAAENSVHILNNSWGPVNLLTGTYEGDEYYAEIPLLIPLYDYYGSYVIREFENIAAIPDSENMVYVWAAGNDYWHEGSFIDLYSIGSYSPTRTVPINDFINGYAEHVYSQIISLNTLNIDPNDPGGYAVAPLFEQSLLGHWVHVIAVDSATAIASFSNGCGEASKYWCLAAAGVDINSLDSVSDTAAATWSGTSFSAPHVAGALAVLKSRLPDMPMSVVLALLFATATDLGEPGVDALYGHGLVNLSAAVTRQGDIALAIPTVPTFFSSTFISTVTSMVTSSITIVTTDVTFFAVTNVFSSTVYSLAVGNATYTTTLLAASAESTVDYQTAEFSQNYGLAQIGAQHAYQRGYFGQGVTVGIVDTGVRTTHLDLVPNLVPGRRADSFGNLNTDVNDAHGHGTFVAGVIGAATDGSRVHGVAPSVSIMPLQFGSIDNGYLTGDPIALFTYAAENSVHILNNNWINGVGVNILKGTYEDNEYYAFIPLLIPLYNLYGNFALNHFENIAAIPGSENMVYVWGSGNDYWHEENFVNLYPLSGSARTITIPINDFISGFAETTGYQTIVFNTLNVDPNDPGGYAVAPLFEPSLLGHWVHVVAVDSESAIANFSNGCGEVSKYWCLAAPGVDITSIDSDSDTDIAVANGTEFAAAHVSGALAVLKSRLPSMPMSVVLAVLFNTATDLGDDGVDAVYGHGLLNLEKAITVQGDIALAVSYIIASTVTNTVTTDITSSIRIDSATGVTHFVVSTVTNNITTTTTYPAYSFITTTVTSDVTATMTSIVTSATEASNSGSGNNNLLSQSSLNLPPVLSGLKDKLNYVSMAVEFLPGYYYNTPLSSMIELSGTEDYSIKLGGAAADMLKENNMQSNNLGFGFSVQQAGGNVLGVVQETDYWRFGYDICDTCDRSLWEAYQSAEIAKPFFAVQEQGMSFAAKLGEQVELFVAMGADEDNAAQAIYHQYGFRWHNANANGLASSIFEFSQTAEKGSLYGGEYSGAFALSDATTYQGRFRTERNFIAGWRGIADYQFGWTNANAQEGGIITDISQLLFDGWRLGVEGNSIFGMPFAANGLMRFGVTRQNAIRYGTMRLRYGVSGNSTEYIDDFQFALNNGYDIIEKEFSLKTEPVMLYHWGYSFTPHDNMQAALGLEYNADSKENAASIQLNWSY